MNIKKNNQESMTETGSMDYKEDYDLIRGYAQQLNGGIDAFDEDSEVTSHESIDEYNHI